jgi:polysaccharide export outer membrane protein
MKQPRSSKARGLVLSGILWATLFIIGCQAPSYQELPPDVLDPTESMGRSDKFRIGDQVLVNFSGSVPDMILQPHKEAVKEDKTITPPLVGPVVAAGRTPGDLQRELQEKYNALYKNLTVTVLPADRYYYVTGEVKKPGPEPYLGETDIIKAISAAYDFTDFANKKSVRLTRANGKTEVVNVQKIINGNADDVPVYPGDKILVKRRLF